MICLQPHMFGLVGKHTRTHRMGKQHTSGKVFADKSFRRLPKGVCTLSECQFTTNGGPQAQSRGDTIRQICQKTVSRTVYRYVSTAQQSHARIAKFELSRSAKKQSKAKAKKESRKENMRRGRLRCLSKSAVRKLTSSVSFQAQKLFLQSPMRKQNSFWNTNISLKLRLSAKILVDLHL